MIGHLIAIFRKHQGQFLSMRAVCSLMPEKSDPRDIKYSLKQLLKHNVIERRQMCIEGNFGTMLYGYGIPGGSSGT